MATTPCRYLSRLLACFLGYYLLSSESVVADDGSTLYEQLVGPTPYPDAFSIAFATNVTNHDSTSSSSIITGHLYYDWSRWQTQRIHHGAGAYECVHFYQTDQPCSLVFRPDGMYRILHREEEEEEEDDDDDCCLDLPEITTPPPDWASRFVRPSYRGYVYDRFAGRMAQEWVFDHVIHENDATMMQGSTTTSTMGFYGKYHSCRQAAFGSDQGKPLVFTFPSAEGRQDLHFNVSSMIIGPVQKSIFDLPDGCAERLCSRITKN